MAVRSEPAGDFDYDARGGGGYASVRQPDRRIAALIEAALGDARTVVNVGAGAGSYEPIDRIVIPIEPSATMRAQRPPHLAVAIDGSAEALPLGDASVDAALACATIHQWPDLGAGLAEMRRVATGPIVILTWDPAALPELWICSYVPGLATADGVRMPSPSTVAELLGGDVQIAPVPVPFDCTDGFIEAYYGRPEALLDPAVRAAQSSWAFAEPAEVERGLAQLAEDLDAGAWDARYGHLRTQPTAVGALRLIVARPIGPRDQIIEL